MLRALTALLAAIVLAVPMAVTAENSTRIGNYTIHHNALTTDNLSPQIASVYRIKRSKNRAMINISVIKNEPGTIGTPVAARVGAVARNLFGQIRTIPLEEIREGTAIYYIGEFQVANGENLTFDIEVVPEGAPYPLRAHFRHQFVTQ